MDFASTCTCSFGTELTDLVGSDHSPSTGQVPLGVNTIEGCNSVHDALTDAEDAQSNSSDECPAKLEQLSSGGDDHTKPVCKFRELAPQKKERVKNGMKLVRQLFKSALGGHGHFWGSERSVLQHFTQQI